MQSVAGCRVAVTAWGRRPLSPAAAPTGPEAVPPATPTPTTTTTTTRSTAWRQAAAAAVTSAACTPPTATPPPWPTPPTDPPPSSTPPGRPPRPWGAGGWVVGERLTCCRWTTTSLPEGASSSRATAPTREGMGVGAEVSTAPPPPPTATAPGHSGSTPSCRPRTRVAWPTACWSTRTWTVTSRGRCRLTGPPPAAWRWREEEGRSPLHCTRASPGVKVSCRGPAARRCPWRW